MKTTLLRFRPVLNLLSTLTKPFMRYRRQVDERLGRVQSDYSKERIYSSGVVELPIDAIPAGSEITSVTFRQYPIEALAPTPARD